MKRPARVSRNAHLLELNLAFDFKREINSAERHCRLGRQPLVALEFVLRQRLPHRLLDLALGGHTEIFEELADARAYLGWVEWGFLILRS